MRKPKFLRPNSPSQKLQWWEWALSAITTTIHLPQVNAVCRRLRLRKTRSLTVANWRPRPVKTRTLQRYLRRVGRSLRLCFVGLRG
jgi:hypothetical protein